MRSLEVPSISPEVEAIPVKVRSIALEVDPSTPAVQLIALLVQSFPIEVESIAELLRLIGHLHQFIADLLRSISVEVGLTEQRALSIELRSSLAEARTIQERLAIT